MSVIVSVCVCVCVCVSFFISVELEPPPGPQKWTGIYCCQFVRAAELCTTQLAFRFLGSTFKSQHCTIGMLFLSPCIFGFRVSTTLIANQLSIISLYWSKLPFVL